MMSADLMQWAWETALWASVAILLVVPLRWVLGRLFGPRVSILAWMLVPLVCLATTLPPRTVEIRVPVDPGPGAAVSAVSPAAPTATRVESRIPAALAAAWAAGGLAWLLALGLRQRALDRRIGARQCRGRICISATDTAGPMVVGAFRPQVLLPADFRTRFSRAQQRLVLAHELTHILRRDPLWNLVAAAFQCLLWFNPLIHWAASRFRRDQELACDAAVLESRSGAKREYAGALLQLDHPPSFGLPAFGGHPLKERITMLTGIRSHSPNRRRLGTSVIVLLALGVCLAAWAADTEIRAAEDAEMFSFDITVTVDGEREEGTLTITGDSVVKPVDGEPVFLARKRLLFEHESEDSAWSAEIEVTPMPDDERFHVDARIERDGETVATPRMIISDKPAYIETADPETGESTYRIDIVPVDMSSPAGEDVTDDEKPALRSAQVFLTIDGNTVAKRVEWPREPGTTVPVRFVYTGEPAPWNARIGLERPDAGRIKMCIESIELGDLSTGAGCMMFGAAKRSNGYMMGELDGIGVAYRLDMVPNLHDQLEADKP